MHNTTQTTIISKHGTAISRWLQAQKRDGKYPELDNIVIDTRARGNIDDSTNVIGTIPMDLAEHANQYYGVRFAKRPGNTNGDMTSDQMQESGAYLQPYTVFPVSRQYIHDVLEYHITNLLQYLEANPGVKIKVSDLTKLIYDNISK